jgi:hypothetical protein
VLLLGHSKGGVDSAAALSLYWPQLKDKVAGLVIAQSPYGGSPVASDILRDGQLGDYVMLRKVMEILVSKVLKVLTSIIAIITMSLPTEWTAVILVLMIIVSVSPG